MLNMSGNRVASADTRLHSNLLESQMKSLDVRVVECPHKTKGRAGRMLCLNCAARVKSVSRTR